MSMRSGANYDTALDSVMLPLLDKCETAKTALFNQLEVCLYDFAPPIFQDGPIQMEEFCLSVFASSDKADRSSPIQPPEIALAGRFYIASLFFDVLTQFHSGGQLPPDLEQKRKYAKYRTLQIRNRQPLDPVEEPPISDPPVVDQSVVAPSAPPVIAKPVETKKTEAVSSGSFRYADDSSSPRSVEAKPTSPRRVDAVAAKKKLQQAVSAIDFGDYATAAALSVEASRILGSN
jgi:hypothetical protein